MTEELRLAKKDFSRLGWALFTIAAVTAAVQLVLSLRWNSYLTDPDMMTKYPWLIWVYSFVPLYLIGAPLGYLIFRKIPAAYDARQKMPRKDFGVLILICMPIMYAGNIIGTFLSLLLSGGTAENILIDIVSGNPLYTFLMAVIVAPVMEEFIFRKQIIDRLGKYGERTAIFVSALTFALFHMNLFQFFYAFGLGILMAYAYTRTRMLRYPVIMHMIINFMGSILAPWVLSLLDYELLDAMAAGVTDPQQLMASLPGLLIYFGYMALLNLLYVAGFVMLIIRWKKRVILSSPLEVPQSKRFRVVWLNWGMGLYLLLTLVFTFLALL